jgi:hypothetical protein
MPEGEMLSVPSPASLPPWTPGSGISADHPDREISLIAQPVGGQYTVGRHAGVADR